MIRVVFLPRAESLHEQVRRGSHDQSRLGVARRAGPQRAWAARLMITTVETCSGPRAYVGLVYSYYERV